MTSVSPSRSGSRASREAAKASSPEASVPNAGWRAWHGGKQPASNLYRVEVEMRDGRRYVDFAGCFRWEQGPKWDSSSDLVRWRPASADRSPQGQDAEERLDAQHESAVGDSRDALLTEALSLLSSVITDPELSIESFTLKVRDLLERAGVEL